MPGIVHAKTVASANALASALGTRLDVEKTFYRWQSTASGANLTALGTLDQTTDRHFMTKSNDIVAGPGLYLAGAPQSSSEYMPKSGGNLIEAKIAPGTLMIDLKDPRIIARAAQLGLTGSDVLKTFDHADNVVVRYTSDWYVAKNVPGQVRFAMYPSPQQTRDDILKAFSQISDRGARAQLVSQVREMRPAMRIEMLRDQPFHPFSIRSLDAHEIGPHLLAHGFQALEPFNQDFVFEYLKGREDLALALRDPRNAGLATSLLQGPLKQDRNLYRAPAPIVEALVTQPEISPEQRARLGQSLLKRFLLRQEFETELPDRLAQLSEWAALGPLDQSAREALERASKNISSADHPSRQQLEAMSRLLEASGMRESDAYVLLRGEHVGRRAASSPSVARTSVRDMGQRPDAPSSSSDSQIDCAGRLSRFLSFFKRGR